MPKYHWEEAKILDESGWKDKNYKEMEANTGLGLYREEWREGLARAFMLACGYPFEETFHDDNKRFGEFFDTLLDNAAGYRTKNLDDKFSEMANVFFEKNPESAKNVGEMPKEASERQSWSKQLLNEMYYAATKKVMQGDYLDIDYLRAYGDDYGKSVDNMLRGLYECASKSMEERIDEKHPDYSDWHESVYTYLYAYRLAKNPYYKDYLDGKPDAIAPGFLKDGKWVRSAAYDTQTPKFDFSVLPDQLEKTDMFDRVFADFTDNPIVRDEEPIVNRIFIDGKNAYDMFKEKYQGAKNYEEHVKREIMQAVMTGEKRVELARLDMTRNGTPKATVVPVTADLSGFDKGKKWYERSVAKKAEDLWKNDKGRESRIEGIKNAVEEKQRAKILSAGYHSTFYNDILAEMNEVRKEFSNPEFLDAERKMKQNPEAAQIWMATKSSTFMLNKAAQDLINNVKTVEDIKNDKELEAIRSREIPNAKGGVNNAGELLDEIIKCGEQLEAANRTLENWRNQGKITAGKFEEKLKETKEDIEDEITQRLNQAGINPLTGGEVNVPLEKMDQYFLANGGTVDDVHKLNAYDAYIQVHDHNIKVMEMMIEKIPDKISSVKDPENFRNDIRSIRSLLETVGINQEDMKKYGENLTGDAKQTFDSIRKWETEMMKGKPTSEIYLPKGMTDAKSCVNQMLKMYQNAFYEKCGYVDKLDADSVKRVMNQVIDYAKTEGKEAKNEAPEKKQVSFNALAKADTAKLQASAQQENVRTSNRNAEKSTGKGTLTPDVKR